MRQTQIFSGSSHPTLAESICARLGQSPAKAELGKFSNGETKVQLNTSIRDQAVFIVQSGGNQINDNVMELLIMISACKSGSARSITAVMPYFPYSRQSKKKSHRGSITARMFANLLDVAGVTHVITIDLHASQMQGFFHCPVDNLVAESIIVHWIKMNIPDWQKAVVVSKNPGGTKRVTTLADALKLDFGIIMTDRRRPGSGMNSAAPSVAGSMLLEPNDVVNRPEKMASQGESPSADASKHGGSSQKDGSPKHEQYHFGDLPQHKRTGPSRSTAFPHRPAVHESSPLARTPTAPSTTTEIIDSSDDDTYDSRSQDVITGRLVHGHIVDELIPSLSTTSLLSNSTRQGGNGHGNGSGNGNGSHSDDESVPDHMIQSFISTTSSRRPGEHALGGSADAAASSDEEEECLKNPELESMVTLVGKVRDRPVIILDDMIDKSTSWIAAAETVIKRGGATKVYCIATHGIFGGSCLEQMEECDCIDRIVVTNSIFVPEEQVAASKKLSVLDVSTLLAEAIRRNRHGESMSQLFAHYG